MNVKVQSRNEEFFKLSAAAAAAISNSSNSDLREQQFHDFIREILVCIFIYCFLYCLAYLTIKYLRKSKESDDYVLDYEDAIADRVSIWLCTFTLATCFGAVLLLPMSIIANEVIISMPQSFYWKWLNSSLLHGLWNLIFLFSNMSLFMFIPFAHLFAESIGLPGYKRGIKSRIIETTLLLFLIAFCVIGISIVISAIFDSDNPKAQSFLNISDYHLPFLYSCISFIGVLFLLICTPLGFARLFTIVSNLIIKSPFRNDLKEELEIVEYEQDCYRRRMKTLESVGSSSNNSESLQQYKQKLDELEKNRKKLERQSKRSIIFRNLCYPFIMIFLLILNTFGILMVAKNTFYVIFGQLPTTRFSSSSAAIDGSTNRHGSSSSSNEANNGTEHARSLNSLDVVQMGFEITLILYFMIASLVGFYNLPFFHKILPKHKSTAMRKIILNCVILLIFSSALPVSSKILGLTRFDLLGHFGNLHWLANIYIILMYNFGFAIATGLCLITKFTATVRSELYNRVLIVFKSLLMSNSTAAAAILINSSRSAYTSVTQTTTAATNLKID